MLGKVFKAYDVRATYPKPLNEKLAWQIGHAAARYLTELSANAGFDDPMMRHVVVGRDMRTSSPALAEALQAGVRDYGAHVVDVGTATATTCQAAGGGVPVRRGIAVNRKPTAKHIMKPWICAMEWNTGW